MKFPVWFSPVVVLSLAALAGATVLVGIETVLRPLVILVFLSFCPGLAMTSFLRVEDPIARLTISVAVSLALDILVVTADLYAGAWSPRGILLVLIAITIAGIGLQAATAAFRHSFERRANQSGTQDAGSSQVETVHRC